MRTELLVRLLLLVCAVAFFVSRAENLPPLHLAESITSLPQGIYLINGMQVDDIVFSMPLTPFLSACIYGLPKWCENLVWPIFYIVMAMLSFAVGRQLRSRLAGAGAVLLMSYALGEASRVTNIFSGLLGPMLFTASCGVVLLTLLMRAGKTRTWQGELLAAVAIGISYMIKSPLALLPPFLVFWEIVSGRLKRGETNWKLMLTLLLVPYAMLLPWIYMNFALDNTFRLFEGGRADENLITGALGIVFTVEGAYPLTQLPQNANFMLWALKTIIAHPITYVEGVIKRIYSIFIWFPLANTAFLLALARLRNERRFRALALFVFYFVGIHSLISIQNTYFAPLWLPVLAGAAALFDVNPATADSKSKSGRLVLLTLLPVLLAGYLIVSGYLMAYPSRAARPSKIFNSEEAFPGANPLLLVRAAEFSLYHGDIPQAYIKARSALLQRYSSLTAATYLRALSARDVDIEPPLRNRLLTRMDHNERLRYLSLLLLNSLEKNRLDETDRLLIRLRSEWRKWHLTFSKVTSERESELYRKQQTESSAFEEEYVPGLLDRLSPGQRRHFAQQLRSLGLESKRLVIMELGALSQDPVQKEVLKERITEIGKIIKDEESMLMLVRLCIKSELYDEAIGYTGKFLETAESLHMRMHLADALLSSEQFEAAQAQIAILEQMHMDNVEQEWLADVKKKRDSYVFQILHTINNKDFAKGIPKARSFLKIQNDVGVRLSFSEALFRAGKYDTAEQFLREIKPSDLEGNQDASARYDKQLLQMTTLKLDPLLHARKYAQVKEQTAALLAWNPNNMPARLYLAEALIETENPGAAQKELDVAAQKKLPPEQWQKMIRLAELARFRIAEMRQLDMQRLEDMFRARNYDGISKLATAILAGDPENAEAKVFLAEALVQKGKLDLAQEQLTQAEQKQLGENLRKQLGELKRKISQNIQMQELDKNLKILDQRKTNPKEKNYSDLHRKAAAALMQTEGYRITGTLHMAQSLADENKLDEALSHLTKLQRQPLSPDQKTWANAIAKQIGEQAVKNAIVEKNKRLKDMESNAAKPSELLPLAQEFAIKYPQDITGKLYLTAALIGTGDYKQAQIELTKLQSLNLDDSANAWRQSLEDYLERERNACSLKNIKACVKKFKR